MGRTEHIMQPAADASGGDAGPEADLLRALIGQAPAPTPAGRCGPPACTTARLIGLAEDGTTALVLRTAAGESVARRARSIVELHGGHIGRDVLLTWLDGDQTQPVVLGVLTGQPGLPLAPPPGQVEIEADGERMVLSARHELILRCGKSRLVLSSDGRVELRGETIVTQASRANRVRGGSVELN